MTSIRTTPPQLSGCLPGSYEHLLVSPAWIADHLDDPDVRIVEVDVTPAAYAEGHIPGAILWNAYTDLRRPDYTPIDSARLEELLSSSGVTPASTLVLYGYGAYLAFWLMKHHNHDRVVVMDGPRERWPAAGFQWSLEKPTVTPSRYVLGTPDQSAIVSLETVRDLIGENETVILDVRSHAEYAGERFWPSGATADAGRAGHIPGAVHVPFDLVRDQQGMLRQPNELDALYRSSGLRADRRVVTYCTIGNRASQVWFVLRHVLGYPHVSVYYGSWVEWGKQDSTPIET